MYNLIRIVHALAYCYIDLDVIEERVIYFFFCQHIEQHHCLKGISNYTYMKT